MSIHLTRVLFPPYPRSPYSRPSRPVHPTHRRGRSDRDGEQGLGPRWTTNSTYPWRRDTGKEGDNKEEPKDKRSTPKGLRSKPGTHHQSRLETPTHQPRRTQNPDMTVHPVSSDLWDRSSVFGPEAQVGPFGPFEEGQWKVYDGGGTPPTTRGDPETGSRPPSAYTSSWTHPRSREVGIRVEWIYEGGGVGGGRVRPGTKLNGSHKGP